eukprot:TRINITY_DN5028_c0_g1_i1.p1 TRINITY_DN5028_c0_g1~~TRINITY_DN5028_c0_g1_i1.p1  ORF type:complete len:308 (-),score=16.43 TRINITY_DN5028_c0_g1_i1:281-1204(-)
MDAAVDATIVTPGELLAVNAAEYLRGHGTYTDESGRLLASVCGVVQRVAKLITIKPMRSRYVPANGDVVVGRITEVQEKNKTWKVDVNGRKEANLLLNAVNLPCGTLRKRDKEDALNMRRMYADSDVLSAEVQEVKGEGKAHLHTRSTKYGKLYNGMLVAVQASLIKKLPQHFVTLEIGVDMILGKNGYIWISITRTDAEKAVAQQIQDKAKEKDVYAPPPYQPTSAAQRQILARVANSIKVLDSAFIAIYPTTIMDVYRASEEANLIPPEMLDKKYQSVLTSTAIRRRGDTAKEFKKNDDMEDDED